MTQPSLSVDLGPLRLSNPVIAGSSELTITEAGITACVDAGAAAVVAKSINEDPGAARQLDIADYLLVGSDHRPRSWARPDLTDSLLNRSGLAQSSLEEWVAMLGRCEDYARAHSSMVVGSVTVSAPAPAAEIARRMAEVVRCVELNLSAPHGRESSTGAVRQVGSPDGVASYTRAVRAAVDCPLIVKLTAQTADVVALATAARDAGADVVALIGRFQGFLPDVDTGEPLLGSAAAIGGGWALPISLYWVSKCHVARPDVPLVGTNGARTGDDVVRFLLSGASAVEMVSALLMRGPVALSDAVADVATYLRRRGFSDVRDLVGEATRKARTYSQLMAERDGRPPTFPWDGTFVDTASRGERGRGKDST